MTNQHPQATYNQYCMRVLSWNSHGSVFGISIPRMIAEKYPGVKWTIEEMHTKEGTKLILTSGVDLVKFKKEVEKYEDGQGIMVK